MSTIDFNLSRYNLYCSYNGGGPADPEINTDGDYVFYEDCINLLLNYPELKLLFKNLKTYDAFCNYDGCGSPEIEESSFGLYVEYDDLIKLIKENLKS